MPHLLADLPEFPLQPLNGTKLRGVLRKTAVSAAGLDGWRVLELKALTSDMLEPVALVLNRIEGGDSWPEDLCHIRACHIAKPDSHERDPLSWRVLSVMPVVYRLWGRVRLRELRGWLQAWVPSELFSARPGAGAADAWYGQAAAIEALIMQGFGYLGGVTDLYKCFDRLLRQVAIAVAMAQGFPGGVARAYVEFHSRAGVRNSLPAGLGELQ
eukprot:8174712-Alexandrium_andersonii.AAC.1